MKKSILLLAAGLLSGFAVSAQQITNQSNTVDMSYSLFQTNSPTNTYGNRWNIVWLNKTEFHLRTPQMFMDSSVGKNLSLTTHPKLAWLDENTGQLKMTVKDSIHWPWDHVTGRPDMSLYYLNTNPSSFISSETDPTVPSHVKSILTGDITTWNTVTGKFNTPTGTISQYLRGDGSAATLPIYTAGTYMSLVGGVFNNIAPDQTVSIIGTGSSSVTGTYPTFTVNSTPSKRQETYSGTTNSSGLYTVSYATSYSVAPNVQFQIGTGGNNKETILLTSSTTTGFSVYVQLRSDVLGLLPSYSNVNGRNVDILVTEK